MRDFKIVLGTLPIASNLLVLRLAALRLIVALDLLPEMLIGVDGKGPGHQSA
jgi:hypothetical protein